jgi:hypothetical protein
MTRQRMAWIGAGVLLLRGPTGARDEFLLAATAQNLRKLAKLIPTQTPRQIAVAPHLVPGSTALIVTRLP